MKSYEKVFTVGLSGPPNILYCVEFAENEMRSDTLRGELSRGLARLIRSLCMQKSRQSLDLLITKARAESMTRLTLERIEMKI